MRILEWYRLDGSKAMRRALFFGAALMASGSMIIGLSFLARQPLPVRIAAAIVGFASIVSGPLVALFGLRGPLREDRYIAVLPEGVLLHFDGDEQLLAWEALERVRFDGEADAVVFALRGGDDVVLSRRFAGVTNAELAKRLDAARRKAGFHLLAS